MNRTAILLCKCRGEHFSSVPYQDAEDRISKLETEIITVDDLCAAVLTHAPELNRIKEHYGAVAVLACRPRAVKHLFVQHGIDLPVNAFINIRDDGIDAACQELRSFILQPGRAGKQTIVSGLEVPSWFPVIDQERCTVCGYCASFCLFGVYRCKEEKITVQQPLNCKNNCPACARACPASAIIFPKIGEGGVISGAESALQTGVQEGIKGNLAARLSDHKAMRESILKASVIRQAEQERISASQKMQNPSEEHHD